jgi:hypothetical protein
LVMGPPTRHASSPTYIVDRLPTCHASSGKSNVSSTALVAMVTGVAMLGLVASRFSTSSAQVEHASEAPDGHGALYAVVHANAHPSPSPNVSQPPSVAAAARTIAVTAATTAMRTTSPTSVDTTTRTQQAADVNSIAAATTTTTTGTVPTTTATLLHTTLGETTKRSEVVHILPSTSSLPSVGARLTVHRGERFAVRHEPGVVCVPPPPPPSRRRPLHTMKHAPCSKSGLFCLALTSIWLALASLILLSGQPWPALASRGQRWPGSKHRSVLSAGFLGRQVRFDQPALGLTCTCTLAVFNSFYCLFLWRDADVNIRYGQALWKHSKDDTTYDVMNLTLDLTMPDDNKQTNNKQTNSAVSSADSSEGSSSGAPTMAPHTAPLRPAIVMIHGGCFSIGSSEWMGSGRSGHGQAGW